MAEGVVSFGLQKLWELLSRESELLQGIDEQVDELRRELGRLQSLLKDADAKKRGSERVRNFLEDVKEIVYDAEDIIESFLLKEVGRKEKGIRKRVKRLACFLVDRRKFAKDINNVTKRASKVIERMKISGIREIIDGGRSLSLQERQRVQREIRQSYPNDYESDLVGVEESVEELVGHLVKNDSVQVFSVSGMGGIGKTTLARQVFRHDIVRRHFDGFAWVCVSQQFTQKDVWKRILKDFRPNDKDISQMDEYTLQRELFKLLETGKYLVVLDDVWKEEDWDRIKAVFPKKGGWRMLLTSRNEGVGKHADPTCIVFRPRILTPEESWKLCERIVFPSKDRSELVDEEMEIIGKEMVTYCGGLPLAVKVLGGLLAKKHTFAEWKRVYDNIGTEIAGKPGFSDKSPNSVDQVLSLSYEDLPMELKHCSLYLALFPEDYEIDLETLFYYWAAEGIINEGLTIEDSGEGYLDELARRNMVIVEKDRASSRTEFCQMHDMMTEVCLNKAREENFLQIVNVPTSTSTVNAQSLGTSRRLAVHSGDAFQMLGHKSYRKARSLLCLGLDEDICMHLSSSGFPSLPLLRVLDLSDVNFEGEKLPSIIGNFIHLRFLSLFQALVSHLPSSLQNLKLLLYLNLRVSVEPIHVPNVLKEMVNLRYLELPDSMDDKTMLDLGDLVNLESLTNFSTKHSSDRDLLHMTKLRVLGVNFTGGYTLETLFSSIRGLRDLEEFSLHDDLQNNCVADHGGEVVLDFIHLKELTLEMYMPKFPDQYRFPPHLRRIDLRLCRMEEDPMPILEKWSHLKSVSLGCGAFVGRRMVCSKGGFPQLCELEIDEQEELEEWIIEEGSMSCLHTLEITYCKKLKELPDGLKYVISLKELYIMIMKREWAERLTPGGEDYYKVQHIPDVQFINYTSNKENTL